MAPIAIERTRAGDEERRRKGAVTYWRGERPRKGDVSRWYRYGVVIHREILFSIVLINDNNRIHSTT